MSTDLMFSIMLPSSMNEMNSKNVQNQQKYFFTGNPNIEYLILRQLQEWNTRRKHHYIESSFPLCKVREGSECLFTLLDNRKKKMHAVYGDDLSKPINKYIVSRKDVISALFYYKIYIKDHEIFLDGSYSGYPSITVLSSVISLVQGLLH